MIARVLFVFTILTLVSSNQVKSQGKDNIAIELGTNLSYAEGITDRFQNIMIPTFTFALGLNRPINSNSSLCIMVQPLGFYSLWNQLDHFGYQANALVAFNLGAGATPNNRSKIGAFAGLGFQYNILEEYYDYYAEELKERLTILGPFLQTGIRFRLGKEPNNGTIGFRFKYGWDFQNTTKKTYEGGISFYGLL